MFKTRRRLHIELMEHDHQYGLTVNKFSAHRRRKARLCPGPTAMPQRKNSINSIDYLPSHDYSTIDLYLSTIFDDNEIL